MNTEQTADKIYQALFGKSAPSIVMERFAKALTLHEQGFPSGERDMTDRAVTKTRDLEALEMAARWTKKLPLLVWEFQVMVRLGETLPENRPRMINDRNRRLRALLALLGAGFRSSWKLAKGLVLLRGVIRV